MKKPVSIFILLLLVSMVSMIGMNPVAANPTTTLYVDPPQIININMVPPATVNVSIAIKDVIDLYTFDFRLNYNTAVLTANSITLGDFFPPDSQEYKSVVNDTAGYVRYLVGMPLGTPKGGGKNGNGALATVNFSVESSLGESILDLVNVKLSDSYALPIHPEVFDGYFSNIPRPWVFVDPSSITGKAIGSTFTININVFNVTNLHASEFKLAYNATLLHVLNVTVGSFMENIEKDINETAGLVEASVSLSGSLGATTTGNATLAMVTFNVTTIGDCDLDLKETTLLSSTGTLITHYTFDGYFSNKAVIHDIAITNVVTAITTVKVENNVTVRETKTVSEVHAGDKVNVTCSVKNNGTVTETFNVTAYYNNTLIGTIIVQNLASGASKIVTITWDTGNVSPGVYTIMASVPAVEGETYMANNQLTEKGFTVLPGQSLPWSLIIAAIIIVVIAVAIAVYVIKIRKPKPKPA